MAHRWADADVEEEGFMFDCGRPLQGPCCAAPWGVCDAHKKRWAQMHAQRDLDPDEVKGVGGGIIRLSHRVTPCMGYIEKCL